MKNKFSVFAVILGLGLSACNEVKTPDGNLPSEYLSAAQSLADTYKGSFNGVDGTLTLELQGAKPVLSFEAANGSKDLLGDSCGSNIGQLLSISKKGMNDVSFALDAGNCQIEGKTVDLEIKSENGATTIKVSVLKMSSENCDTDSSGNYYCIPDDFYMNGKFQR